MTAPEPIPEPTDSLPPLLMTGPRGADIRPDGNGGHWIEPRHPDEHQCPLPQQWTLGALWQCPDGHLWIVRASDGFAPRILQWWPAKRWQRPRFGPGMKRARLSMATRGQRVQNTPKPAPPKGPSGVSPPPPLPYNPGGPVR